jgi:hypothetical protein
LVEVLLAHRRRVESVQVEQLALGPAELLVVLLEPAE